MQRFRFPLDTLLEVRKREEEEVKRELGEKNRDIHEAQGELADLHSQLKNLQATELSSRARAADVTALRHSVAFRHKLKTDMLAKGREIQGLQLEAENVRRNLVAATQRRRAIELVRERRYKEWQHEYQVHEQKLTDDVSQQKYIRDRKALTKNREQN